MKDLGIGKLITTEQFRDAIHVAVAPVVAAERLASGWHVGLNSNGEASVSETPVGIVDPFLRDSVASGKRFWLFLYPGSITSLRHDWTHPAFSGPCAQPDGNKEASRQWMTDWALKHMGEDYYGDGEISSPDVALARAIDAGERNHVGPYEDARDYIDNEWWNHWETITGKRGDRDAYFSCSC